MATVIEDVIDSPLEEAQTGYQHARRFRIYDVTGPADQRIYNSLIDPQIPQRGDPHPTIPGIEVRRRRSSPDLLQPDHFIVEVNYAEIESQELLDDGTAPVGSILDKRLSTRLGEARTTRDKDGIDIADDGGGIRTIAYEDSSLVFRFSRVESSIAAARTQAATYLGHLNSATWSGDPARTWRMYSCDAYVISGRNDGAARSDWEMIYKASTWDEDKRFYINGILAEITTVLIYPDVDFAPLIPAI